MPTAPTTATSLSRRALLGMAPLGAIWWTNLAQAQAGTFRFIVINDLHHATEECNPFFRSLVAQMASHGAIDFCLIVGDIADTGLPQSFAAVKSAFAALGVPIYTVPGNHDNDVDKSTRLYAEAFPGRLNYTFSHKGWQFIGLDSTEAEKPENTRISDTTLAWLDKAMPTLDRGRPTLLFTHFPLGAGVNLRPLNADDLLARFKGVNLRAAFTGHYHARVERPLGEATLVTNACCSRMRDNHDGSLEEGYVLCTASADGGLSRQFVEFLPARKKA